MREGLTFYPSLESKLYTAKLGWDALLDMPICLFLDTSVFTLHLPVLRQFTLNLFIC